MFDNYFPWKMILMFIVNSEVVTGLVRYTDLILKKL
jgi:hypothetical protein